MNDRHRLRFRLAVAEHDLAVGRAGRVAQPLELEARVDVGQTPVAVLRDVFRLERLPAGRQDDVADVQLQQLVFLVEANRIGRAQLFAGPALLPLEPDARIGVNHRNSRDGLREGRVDRLPRAHPGLELRVDHFARALLDADAATRAGIVIHAPGFLADGDLEVAHGSFDGFHFGICQQGDVLVLARFGHLGRQNARRAVQCRERLVELGHVAADRRGAFDQVDVVAGVRQLQRGLQTGNAAADHERLRIDVDVGRLQRLLELDPLDSRRHQRFGLERGRLDIFVHPRTVFADVGHVQQVRIETRVGAGPPERLLMQVGAAGGHDDPCQPFLLDVLLDDLLTERGTHELVVARDGNIL